MIKTNYNFLYNLTDASLRNFSFVKYAFSKKVQWSILAFANKLTVIFYSNTLPPFIQCTLLISFERSGKLTNKIPYQLIMLPFLFPVSKWHFTRKEYNKQFPETYLDEIQKWIKYLSTKYALNFYVGLTTIQYSSMCSKYGLLQEKGRVLSLN